MKKNCGCFVFCVDAQIHRETQIISCCHICCFVINQFLWSHLQESEYRCLLGANSMNSFWLDNQIKDKSIINWLIIVTWRPNIRNNINQLHNISHSFRIASRFHSCIKIVSATLLTSGHSWPNPYYPIRKDAVYNSSSVLKVISPKHQTPI